jgi:undecaprenyl-diphosphatase
MDLLQTIVLGIVQGITEWLPVSSSGHIVIFENLFGISAPIILALTLHLGTLIAVCAVFWKDIINVLKAIIKLDFKSEYGKLALFIIIAMIPTAIIGFTFKSTFESFFNNLNAVGIALILTGCFLFICERWEKKNILGLKESILIGIAQGIAIIPGISRSGATIGTGLLAGVEKQKVARFSFLLSIPAIIGAAVFDVNMTDVASVGLTQILIGMVTSAIVGYLTIKFLLNLINKQKFHWFAVYCWVVGILIVLFANKIL